MPEAGTDLRAVRENDWRMMDDGTTCWHCIASLILISLAGPLRNRSEAEIAGGKTVPAIFQTASWNKQKRPDLHPGVLRKTNQTKKSNSAGVKFDDELLVDERFDVGTLRHAGNGGFELVLVHAQPIHHRHRLGEIGHAEDELL